MLNSLRPRTGQLAMVRLLLLAILLLALAGCGGSGVTQTTQTERYKVQLELDGVSFDQHTATVEINDLAGQPISDAQVTLAPVMEAMGMAAPEQPAQMVAPGRYQAKGAFFSMIGEWEFDVRISAAGKEDVARFKVQSQQ